MDLRKMIKPGEKILWEGRPDRRCLIIDAIFNPSFLFMVTGLFLYYVFMNCNMGEELKQEGKMWIMYLLGFGPIVFYSVAIILNIIQGDKIRYLLTDQAVYYSFGLIDLVTRRKPLAELSKVEIQRRLFDRIFGVADVVMNSTSINTDRYKMNAAEVFSGSLGVIFLNIKDYENLYSLLNKLTLDTYSDIMYPNALRPTENPGYRTGYKGLADENKQQ